MGPRGEGLAGAAARLVLLAPLLLSAAPADPPVDRLLADFVAGLQSLRAGDDAAAGELGTLAQLLCAKHGRCDAVAIAGYYASLPRAERVRGLEYEARYGQLFDRVRDAGQADWDQDVTGWRSERAAIRAELDALLSDCRDAADPAPAGRALSLSALLLSSRLDDADLAPTQRQGLVRRAEAQARESIELLERVGLAKVALEPRETLARLLADSGRLGLAHSAWVALQTEAESVGSADYRERALLGRIDLAGQTGDTHAAERHIRTLATFRDPAESWFLAHRHGWHLLTTDNAPQAMAFLERNRPGPEQDQDLVEWNFLMSMAAVWHGDPARAQAHLDEARYDVPGFEPYVLAQARIDLARGEYHAVLSLLSDGYSLDALTPQQRVIAQSILGEALLRSGMVDAAAEELEVALELCEQWVGMVADERTPDDGPLGVIGEWMGLHTIALLAEAYAELGRDLDAARLIEDCQSRSLRNGRDLVELRLRAGQPAGGARLTHDDLRAWAGRTELGLVTWVVGAEHTVVVHVTPTGQAQTRVARLGRSQIQEGGRRLFQRALNAERRNAATRLRETGAGLAARLLPDSLLTELATGGAHAAERRLLVLVHGPIEDLPFSLLAVGGRPLDDLCTLQVLPGLPSERPGPAVELDLREWSLMGAPTNLTRQRELAAAREELFALGRRYGDLHTAIGSDFDAAHVEHLLTAKRPVHVSTHLVSDAGCAAEHRSDVGLLLSDDGVLCIERIADLAPALPLAVLAACETGRGQALDAEGQQSMARIFLESGTRNILVTLWPVADEAARRFGECFHDALGAGASPSEAARRARTALRAAGAPAAEWAVFRLVGRD